MPTAPALADVLTKLYARIPMGMRLGLEPMRDACKRFGHPERDFETVHVAGTNGKGSVCAMVESIARQQGRKTGLFTSPHLCRFAERIRLQGEPIDDGALAHTLGRVLDSEPNLSFFESATLAAWIAFRDAKVDVAVVEVGMGGRLDATNVLPTPRAAAITRIALDHVEWLGPTLVDIAREKAGIAKPGLDIVLGPMPPEIRKVIDIVARAHGASTSDPGNGPPLARVGLEGAHQRDNARIAATLAERIGASPVAIGAGIAQVRWPGRLERVGRFLLDAAHNPDGALALAGHVRALGLPPSQVALIFGSLGDKDWPSMLDALAPLASTRVYVAPTTASRMPADPAVLATRHAGLVANSVAAAFALVPPRGLVVLAGSILLVGDARALLLGLSRDPPAAL